jgi:hypothetical protein
MEGVCQITSGTGSNSYQPALIRVWRISGFSLSWPSQRYSRRTVGRVAKNHSAPPRSKQRRPPAGMHLNPGRRQKRGPPLSVSLWDSLYQLDQLASSIKSVSESNFGEYHIRVIRHGHSHFNIWSTLAMMSLLNFSHCSDVGGNSQGKMTSSRSSMSTLNQ